MLHTLWPTWTKRLSAAANGFRGSRRHRAPQRFRPPLWCEPLEDRITPADHFVVSAPAIATAGTAFIFTVTAETPANVIDPTYSGTVHFTSSDTKATLPADSMLTGGVGTFGATLDTAGSQTITATDTVNSAITGTSNAIAVSAAAANHFVVSAPSSATAGTAFLFTVTAEDQFGNTDTAYAGTVDFTSTDPKATLPTPSTLTSGTGTFSATLDTAGTQNITVHDSVNASIDGTSNPIDVSAAAATQFAVSAPAAASLSTPFNFTVTAEDQFGNPAPSYGGTVHFTSTDPSATLPANSMLASGVGTFSATLNTLGTQTLTATDTVTPSITGTSSSILVTAATHFVISAPSTATAGTAFMFTVTAENASGGTVTNYSGTVHFTSTDAKATLPANTTLTNGVGTFNATLDTAGSQTITAADTVISSLTGTSNAITVSPAAVSQFAVSAPVGAIIGTPFNFTVTAEDPFGNTVPSYSGTVHFTSTDTAATLPANSMLTSGVGTFSATLNTGGMQTITATDTVTPSITGTSSPIAVSDAPTHFYIIAPSSTSAGTAFSITVEALDASDHTAIGYTGTVHFTSTDPKAMLPANSTLTDGVGTFNATLYTASTMQTITATDTVNSSLTGTSLIIDVFPDAATQFAVSAPIGATIGSPFNFTVTAEDQYDNTATSYTGTVHFTSSDSKATLPANSTLTNGVGTFSATLNTGGMQTLTATDTVTSSITGTSSPIAVSAAATHFLISAPSTATGGKAFTITVTAEAADNTTAIGYTGTVHFTSTDSKAVLPANATLTDGVGTFTVTLNTGGSQTITATDTVNSSLAGTSGPITVSTEVEFHAGVFDPATATWTLDLLGTGNYAPGDATYQFGVPGDTGIIGDWNGAGYDEIGIYRVDTALTDPATGLHPLVFSLNVSGTGTYNPSAGDVSFVFGLQGDTVVVGDWLGNGKDEIGVVRPGANGLLVWSLNTSSGNSGAYMVDEFGLNTDKPVVGNWSGGKTEIGTVRAQGGALVWSLNVSGTGSWNPAGGDVAYTFGLATDTPIVGDWNGAGKDEIGVYRTSGVTLAFTLDTNGDGIYEPGTDQVGIFGLATDTVLVGDWNGNGKDEIGTARHSSNAQDILFSLDLLGDLAYGPGDLASTTGLPGGDTAQSFAGQWKGNS